MEDLTIDWRVFFLFVRKRWKDLKSIHLYRRNALLWQYYWCGWKCLSLHLSSPLLLISSHARKGGDKRKNVERGNRVRSSLQSKLKTTSSAAQLTTYTVWWCICRPKLVSDKCAGAGLYVAKGNRAKWTCTLFYVVTRGNVRKMRQKIVWCISCEMQFSPSISYKTWRAKFWNE
jgi:hypothetical protein